MKRQPGYDRRGGECNGASVRRRRGDDHGAVELRAAGGRAGVTPLRVHRNLGAKAASLRAPAHRWGGGRGGCAGNPGGGSN